MADINLSNNVGTTVGLKIRDDSPLAKAKLTQLLSTAKSLVAEIDKPVDQSDIGTVDFVMNLSASSIPIGAASVVQITGGVKGSLEVIKSAGSPLFADDGFSPIIPIAKDTCWVAFHLVTTLGANAAGTIDGFGVGVKAASTAIFSTYCRLNSIDGVFPSLKESIEQALGCYSLSCSSEAIRKQAPGTVNVAELSGTVTFTGSYTLPVTVNALAMVNLPFNYGIAVEPSPLLSVAGSIELTGEFVVRCFKVSETELTLGVYKKTGTALTACLTAGLGLEAEAGTTDLLASLFNTAMGRVDLNKASIPADAASQLRDALKASLNRSLSISMNVECAASSADEAAVVFSVDLATGDSSRTDAALGSALKGNWTDLANLPNAKQIRNITRAAKEIKHIVEINLLGIYNAASIDDFAKSCTILHDENGRIVITDAVTAKHLSITAVPFGADADKLRQALAQAFLSTVTYTAGAPESSSFKAELSVSQTYFRYAASMPVTQVRREILFGTALGLVPGGAWDKSLASQSKFDHVRVSVSATYKKDAALWLFFADPVNRVARDRAELERVGREIMKALIWPGATAAAARLAALESDQMWEAMNKTGAMANFGEIPELARFSATEVAAIAGDWADIEWWADAMVKVAPRLSDMLVSSDRSTAADPSKDANWMAKRKALADVLANVARNSRSTFAEGWGLAVMFALSRKQADAEMDICASGRQQHYISKQTAVMTGSVS